MVEARVEEAREYLLGISLPDLVRGIYMAMETSRRF
jgi:hypothetical protein